MSICSSKFISPILKRIADSDLSVLQDINEDNANITEEIRCYGKFNPLILAAFNGNIAVAERLFTKNSDGSYEFPDVIQNVAEDNNYVLCLAAGRDHFEVVERLLAKNSNGYYEFTNVIQNISADGNFVLRFAAFYGRIEVVEKLLAKNTDGSYEFLSVIQNVAADNNFALRFAARNGHIDVVKRLLAKNADGSYEFPDVIQNIAADNNFALRLSSENNYFELAYVLAGLQWPNGIKELPEYLRDCTSAIRQGEIISNTREVETTQLLRWLQVGYIPTSRQDLCLPPELSSKELQETTTVPLNVLNIIKGYVGTQSSIDTSRPTTEELTMISGICINLLKSSSSIMNCFEKARIAREENELSSRERYIVLDNRLGFK